MEQEKALCQGTTLFQVFLDLTKAYDTLDRERTLALLQGYGMGPNSLCLLKCFWDGLVLCAKQGGYYGRELIQSDRGVTQGGVASPTIFNIVVDAIIREMLYRRPGPSLTVKFYADDGRLASTSDGELQGALDDATELFRCFGMEMNPIKTKAMVGHNGSLRLQLSSPAYKRRMDGEGDTYHAAKHRCVECPICHAQLQERSLPRHIHTRHGDIHRPYKRRRLLEDSTRPSVRYFVYSPRYRSPLDCPVPGCPGTASTRDAMRNHFCH